MESSLFVKLLESGAAPWAMIIVIVTWAMKSVATHLLRMDPKLVDAFTRWRVTGRIIRRSDDAISPQQVKELLTLPPSEQPSQEDQR